MSRLLPLEICALGLVAVAQARGDSSSEVTNSQVCGPRCVRRVLADLGQESEFIDLVREIQGDALDQPADLARIKSVLEAHGAHTTAIRVDPTDLSRLAWQGPVVVHYAPRKQSPGHFVVLYPAASKRGRLYVWDGLRGARLVPADEVVPLASGVILLVSSTPIDQPAAEYLVPRGWQRWRWAVFGVTVSLIAVCLVAARRMLGASVVGRRSLVRGVISCQS